MGHVKSTTRHAMTRPSRVVLALSALRTWSSRHVLVAVGATVVIAVVVGLATVLIPNHIFARDIAPVWWNYPVWILTSALTGMLIATYVNPEPTSHTARSQTTRADGMGVVGTALAWFAVGCPVCNKIALLAFGYSGALTWLAPFQPFLAIGAFAITGTALVWRLSGQLSCPLPQREVTRVEQ